MKIGIICGYPIPIGMAATTRIFAYSKGLVASGAHVDVYSYTPNDFPSDKEINDMGIFDGVSYFYSYKRKKSKNKILHGLSILLSLLILGPKLYWKNKKTPYDAFIISTDGILPLSYLCFCNFFFKKKLIFIFDEYPTPIRGALKERLPKWKEFIYSVLLRRFTGYISMTRELLTYYQKIIYRPGIILSTITDTSRFEAYNIQNLNNNKVYTLTYLGNMELSKDNVDNIIYAFSLLTKKHNVLLNLFGTPQAKDKSKLKKIISDLNLNDKITFRFISYDNIPKILTESHILVSSQPRTKRAAGGFPTKLGEYLMSGRPTLLTDVGETSHFFKHKEHMFFAPPHDPISYAEQLDYIINNYDEALRIAAKGRELIIKEYSHLSAGIKIRNFLNQL